MTEAIKLTHSKPTGMRKSTKKKALNDTTAPVAVLACVITLAETIGTNKPGKFRLDFFTSAGQWRCLLRFCIVWGKDYEAQNRIFRALRISQEFREGCDRFKGGSG
jgi:hypothetical protein